VAEDEEAFPGGHDTLCALAPPAQLAKLWETIIPRLVDGKLAARGAGASQPCRRRPSRGPDSQNSLIRRATNGSFLSSRLVTDACVSDVTARTTARTTLGAAFKASSTAPDRTDRREGQSAARTRRGPKPLSLLLPRDERVSINRPSYFPLLRPLNEGPPLAQSWPQRSCCVEWQYSLVVYSSREQESGTAREDSSSRFVVEILSKSSWTEMISFVFVLTIGIVSEMLSSSQEKQ